MSFLSVIGYSFWLGFLCSISPCPLSTNIAAIAFVGKDLKNPKKILITGLLYTLSRALTYTLLGVAMLWVLGSSPLVSLFIEKNMGKAMGLLLIVVGMFLLELISFGGGSGGTTAKLQRHAARFDYLGAIALGFLFALAFCPVSAALFFGSLLPVAQSPEHRIIAPFTFGLGTSIPVLFFTVVMTISARALSTTFNRVKQLERYTRMATGVLFILMGLYLTVTRVFLA